MIERHARLNLTPAMMQVLHRAMEAWHHKIRPRFDGHGSDAHQTLWRWLRLHEVAEGGHEAIIEWLEANGWVLDRMQQRDVVRYTKAGVVVLVPQHPEYGDYMLDMVRCIDEIAFGESQ